jgi:hypothetical protein
VIRSVEHLIDGSIEIVAEIAVGVETRQARVPLGRFESEIDPGGLRNTPVVVLSDPALETTVRTGAERAGKASVARVEADSEGSPGASLLRASSDAEVLLVVSHGAAAGVTLVVARMLGGRPLPVIAFDEPSQARAMLRDCDVDLDVAVPSVEEPLRGRVRDGAEQLGLFVGHHVVEVDPRPALADVDDTSHDAPTLNELAAGASGVLAGRLAVGNRRWR